MKDEQLKITEDPGILKHWMIDYVSSILDVPMREVSTSDTFDAVGIDSVEAVIMAGVLEEQFGIEIDPMLFFENPSIDTFVAAYAGAD